MGVDEATIASSAVTPVLIKLISIDRKLLVLWVPILDERLTSRHVEGLSLHGAWRSHVHSRTRTEIHHSWFCSHQGTRMEMSLWKGRSPHHWPVAHKIHRPYIARPNLLLLVVDKRLPGGKLWNTITLLSLFHFIFRHSILLHTRSVFGNLFRFPRSFTI